MSNKKITLTEPISLQYHVDGKQEESHKKLKTLFLLHPKKKIEMINSFSVQIFSQIEKKEIKFKIM